jgi:hypothetical protein
VAVTVYQQRVAPSPARFAAMVTHLTTAAQLWFAARLKHISWSPKARTAIHKEAWHDEVSSPSGRR